MFFQFLHWLSATGPTFASADKILPWTPPLFLLGGGDTPFYKLTPIGDCGLAISSPPLLSSLLDDVHKAGKRIVERQPRIYNADKCDWTRPIPIRAGSHCRTQRFTRRMTQLITLSYWGGLDTDGLQGGLIYICIYNKANGSRGCLILFFITRHKQKRKNEKSK